MIRFLTLLVFVCCFGSVWSQDERPNRSTLPPEDPVISEQVKTPKEKGRFKKNWKQPYPNPVRAGVFGLFVPGAGQIYNKDFWKVPLVWGAVGGVVYWADFSRRQYKIFNRAYGLRLASERTNTTPTDEFVGIARNSDALKRVRDKHDKNRQVGIIAIIGVHALQALEAYVDAQLKNFDIDDDLSLHFGPVVSGTNQTGSYLGLGVKVSF